MGDSTVHGSPAHEQREARRLERLVVLGAFVRGELSAGNELAALTGTWEQAS